ncbi:MAG: V-type ATPase 116kDa subunit family protein [Nitrososphaerota archaeon]|nr:V-type ATPase 116kDa subunit family protein [Nitrososphaerota archaeon]
MGIVKLVKARVLTTRRKAEDVLNELYRFGEFHVEESEGERLKDFEDLYATARELYLELEAAVRELNVSAERGPLEVLTKGDLPDPEVVEVSRVREALERLESESRPTLEELRGLRKEQEEVSARIRELRRRLDDLEALTVLGREARHLRGLKRLRANVFVVPSSAVEEVRKAFQDFVVTDQPIGEGKSVVLVLSRVQDADRVLRIARGMNLAHLRLETVPEDPAEEAAKLRAEIESLESRRAEVERRMAEIRLERGPRIAALRDLAQSLRSGLDKLREQGLRRVVVIEGYLPEERREEFLRTVGGKAYVELEEVEVHGHHGGHSGHQVPTLVRHGRLVESFSPVTKMQGVPGYNEVDPTPFVSVFIVVFYGIMFADLGQGLVIMTLGLLLWRKARGYLRTWGKLLTFLGAGAASVGFLIQEAFGFGIYEYTGIKPVVELMEKHGGTKTLSQAAVLTLFTFAPFLGAVHILLGMLLGAVKYAKQGELGEAVFSKGVTMVMYLMGILFAIAFIGAGGFEGLTTLNEPAPIIGLPVATVGTVALYGIVACLVLLVVGRPLSSALGIGPKTSLVSGIGAGLLEILENIIHFMSNTLSYLRVPILMVIHASLMLLVNSTYAGLGLAALPILVIGNLGVMALEGTLAFIQALRLHLYEFFSKFYEGSGKPFEPLRLDSRLVRILIR